MGLRNVNRLSRSEDITFTDEGPFNAQGQPVFESIGPQGGRQFNRPEDLPRPGFIAPQGQPTRPGALASFGELPQLQGGAFAALRSQALATGPSNFARLQTQRAEENIASQAAGQAATAKAKLAARGGLSTGARERVETDIARTALLGGQQTRLSIAQQDAQRRQGLLQALPGLEVRRFQAQIQPQLQQAGLLQQASQFDATQQAEANRLENIFNIAEADRQAQILAAQIQGRAIENA